NAGGSSYHDSESRSWAPDTDGVVESTFVFKQVPPHPIVDGEGLEDLYNTERHAPVIEYVFAMDPGDYDVILHFAEIFSGITEPGQRLFDIVIEGNTVMSGVDIYQLAGDRDTAITLSFPQSVSDGNLSIQLVG